MGLVVMNVVISVDDSRTDDVRELLARHVEFAHATTCPEEIHALDVEQLPEMDITLFSARRRGELLGVGALRRLDHQHVEIKSMHVARSARGQGVGRVLLGCLLDAAANGGYRRVSIETGSQPAFDAARALYAAAGFAPCGPFGSYQPSPNSVCMTRAVAPGPSQT